MAIGTSAQQLPQFSLRSYDIMSYNPAVAGSKMNQEVRLHHRSQWVGFEDAPTTDILSFNASVTDKVGLGGYAYFDSQGPTRNYGFNLSYAYHLLFTKFNLSLGAAMNLKQYQFNTSILNPYDTGDPLVPGDVIRSKFIPDITTGFYAYNRSFYLGASLSMMMKTKLSSGVDGTIPANQLFYLMGGYNFGAGDNFNFMISTFLTANKGSSPQAEIGFKAEYLSKFLAGLAYRNGDAIVLTAGMRIQKFIFVAYSYDVVISKLRQYNSGSHELILFIEFNKKRNQYYQDDSRKYKGTKWH